MKYSPILIVFLLLQSLYNLNAQNKKVENLRLDDSKTIRFGYYLGINFLMQKTIILKPIIVKLLIWLLKASLDLMLV